MFVLYCRIKRQYIFNSIAGKGKSKGYAWERYNKHCNAADISSQGSEL